MRAALALGLPSLARGVGRMRRLRRDALARAGREACCGNVPAAAALAALFLAGL